MPISGNAPPPPLPGQADTSGYDQIIAASPVADPASIPAGSWADKIKQRGKLIRGGTDSGPLFFIKDPATGKVTGSDAGLAALDRTFDAALDDGRPGGPGPYPTSRRR